MAATTSSAVVSAVVNDATRFPSRSTTMRSATANTSTRLWLMMITPWPSSRSSLMRSSTCWVWATPSAAVGSSRMTTLGSPIVARATAMDWRCPPDSDATSVRTLGMLTDRRSSRPSASCSMPTSSRTPRLRPTPRALSRPTNRLATTSRLSHSARSWYTVAIPISVAACGVVSDTFSPSKRIVPASAGPVPAMTFTRVDLPAPLSPTRRRPPRRRPRSRRRRGPARHRSAWTRHGAPAGASPRSRDAGLFAGGSEVALADLIGGPEAVGDDRVGHVVGGDGHRVEDHRRDLGLAVVHLLVDLVLGRVLAAGQGDGHLGGDLRLGLDGLVHGHVLVAGEDALDAGELGVLPGHGRDRVDARAAHGGDGAAGRAVVGGVDADEAVGPEAGDGLLHLRLGLVSAPVRCVVLGADLVGRLVDDRVRPLLELGGVVVGRRAVDHHDRAGVLAVLGEPLGQRLGLELADPLVVVADVVVDRCVGDEPVVGQDRHVLGLGLRHHRAGGGAV